MPRHQLATIHELARLDVFASLPGETLGMLASHMTRIALDPGERLVPEPDDPGRYWVVLSGMLSVGGRIVREGTSLGGREVLGGPAQAIVPTAVATCDGEAFDLYVRPAIER